MSKLLNAYRTESSLKNAQAVACYDRRHPMTRCMLTPDDNELILAAVRHAYHGTR